MMIVRLHNLSARSPVLDDAVAVSELLHLGDCADTRNGTVASNDVRKRWQAPGFQLANDAWIIVTKSGLVAGYADVRRSEATAAEVLTFVLTVCVHPDYRERGVETLLIWLAEERARQLSRAESAGRQITISTLVSSRDTPACENFLHEGYISMRRVWRVTISVEEMPDVSSGRGPLTVDLLLDEDDLPGTNLYAPDAGDYISREYEVYEKTLHMPTIRMVEPMLDMQCMGD